MKDSARVGTRRDEVGECPGWEAVLEERCKKPDACNRFSVDPDDDIPVGATSKQTNIYRHQKVLTAVTIAWLRMSVKRRKSQPVLARRAERTSMISMQDGQK